MKDFLIETIKEAGAIAKRYFQEGVADISEKSYKHDPLTEADTSVSDFFIAQVQKTYPEHGIFSEEEDHIINKGAEYEWVIDPIDGTKNFAIGIPDWCVSIALTKNGETIMGALYNPISEQLFFAEKGKGAYLDNVQIHVNNTQRVQGSFGHIIRSAGGGVYGDYFDRYGRLYSRIVTETNSRLVNFGNVFHMAFVATGGIDYAIGNTGMTWDFLSLFLICEEAGAVVTDSDGNPWKRGRQDYIIANKELHSDILSFIHP